MTILDIYNLRARLLPAVIGIAPGDRIRGHLDFVVGGQSTAGDRHCGRRGPVRCGIGYRAPHG